MVQSKPLDKIQVLKDVDFGSQIAEQEQKRLATYFVQTDQWRRLVAGDVDVIYGPKGTGKSALYLLLLQDSSLEKRGVFRRSAENPKGDTAFSSLVVDPPSSEDEFRRMWKLYLLSLVGSFLREKKLASDDAKVVCEKLASAGLLPEEFSLGELLKTAVEYVRRFIRPAAIEPTMNVDPATGLPTGFSAKIIFDPPSAQQKAMGVTSVDKLFELADRALQTANKSLWVCIDRLDVAFAERPDLEANALRSLFRVYLDLQSIESVKLKIFLRSDIWSRITSSGFREASHITKTATIVWKSEDLMNLVVRRLLSSGALKKHYGVDEKILANIQAQQKLFYRVFPDQVEPGTRKPTCWDWMLSRVRDGKQIAAPRELIHFLMECRNAQIAKLEIGSSVPEGELLLSRAVLKESLLPVSTVRLNQTLYSEFPSLKPSVEKLRKQKSTQAPDSLARIWNVSRDDAMGRIENLLEVGLFEKFTDEPLQVRIPFLYRPALESVMGRDDRDAEED